MIKNIKWARLGLIAVSVGFGLIVALILVNVVAKVFFDISSDRLLVASLALAILVALPAIGVGIVMLVVAGVARLVNHSPQPNREYIDTQQSSVDDITTSLDRAGLILYGVAVGAMVLIVAHRLLPLWEWASDHYLGLMFLTPIVYLAMVSPEVAIIAAFVGAMIARSQNIKLLAIPIFIGVFLIIFYTL